ncbi:hypothetical protein ABZ914_19955, partial [Spirillospora sp. NPDC046719]
GERAAGGEDRPTSGTAVRVARVSAPSLARRTLCELPNKSEALLFEAATIGHRAAANEADRRLHWDCR